MKDTIASTTYGRVRGCIQDDLIHVFKGIPYAASVSGKQRFLPAKAPAPWGGILDTLEYGPACPQPNSAMFRLTEENMDEDCLKINIWTPALDGGKRAVMVWLHGGGFIGGTSASPMTDGSNLARHGDVVIVSLNHRLNVFGFLYLEPLCAPEFAGSGNTGMMDIIFALQWVRDNIAAFGGDPGNVTLFGESGGGRKVNILLGMPAASGLFHRGIIQSGAHPRGVPIPLASRFTEGLFDWLGLRPGDLAALQDLSAERLFKETARFVFKTKDPSLPLSLAGRWMLLSPVLDGTHLPANPFYPASPEGRDVPLMIGSNKDEMAIFYANEKNAGRIDEQELLKRLRPVFGDRTESVVEIHRRNRPQETPWDLLVSISSEDRRLLSIETAERKIAAGGAPVYVYFFVWESNFGLLKASHVMEIPFVFDNLDQSPIVGTREDRHALAKVMSQTWRAFARTGDPNHEGLPRWEPYDTERRPTMLFDMPARLEYDPRGEERRIWDNMKVPLPWEGTGFVGFWSNS
jgi:para-nitrobenzyl esterase